MTVVWHVDDLKVSHAKAIKITKLAMYLDGIYPGLKVNRGKIHDYLGMNLDFSEDGNVKVSMIPYLLEILHDLPELPGDITMSPAANHLVNVRSDKEAQLLPEEQAISFHHFIARLLFMSSRVRRDIQTAVVFLTTRVKAPDEDDWGKLKRVLKYLKGTRGLVLTLSVDDMSIIKWWINASYATHDDCKGHRGAIMSLGKGAVTSASNKHKI